LKAVFETSVVTDLVMNQSVRDFVGTKNGTIQVTIGVEWAEPGQMSGQDPSSRRRQITRAKISLALVVWKFSAEVLPVPKPCAFRHG
jgi:hypothetical protein